MATTGFSLLFGWNAAFAQQVDCQKNPTAPGCQQNGSVETVVVTGTRIPNPETESISPVIAVGSQQLQFSGTINLTDYLKTVPALIGSLGDLQESGLNTTQTNAGSSLSGLNLLDLRNLGFDRTLVLEDGQRIVSSSAGDAAVDTNSIPITLIDRIDVVTGGSSAIYGADGVSGVVNFIMKHDLDGIDARFQAGDPQDGGNSKFVMAGSIGKNFDNDNGNIEFTIEDTYENRLNYTQRPFTNTGGAAFFVPNPNNLDGTDQSMPANILTKNGTIWQVASTSAIITNPLGVFTTGNTTPAFLGNGQVYNPGNIINGEFANGGDGLPLAPAFLADLGPIRNNTIVQVTGDEQFNKWFKLSGEFRFSSSVTKSQSEPSFNEFATITSDNPFLPANVQQAILNNGTFGFLGQNNSTAFIGSYPYQTPGLVLSEAVHRDVYRGVLGLDGEFPLPDFFHDATYDLHYVYGQSDIRDDVENNLAEDRYYAALDSVEGPNGPTCRTNLNAAATPETFLSLVGANQFDEVVGLNTGLFGTTFTPGPNSGCVAYNPFVTNSAQDIAAAHWMTMTTPTFSLIHQQDLNGYVSWDFPQFSDWGLTAKPVNFVLGGEWRQEFSKSDSDPITRQTPIPGEPGRTQSLFFDSGGNPVEGQFSVGEGFGEVSVPVFSDQFLAQDLTFDLAGRVSNYSTAGTDETWKIGGDWAPIADIKFRATDAYAVRAPNIGELFAPLVQGFEGINDPCDVQFINQGTPFRKNNCQQIMNMLGVNYTAGVTSVQQPVTLPVLIGGNEGLHPEAARTLTLGTVIQPSFIPNLSLTADWYRVSIADAISALSGQTIANQCVDLSTIVNPFCKAITRNGPGAAIPGSIEQEIAQEINVANFFTSGVDFTATYFQNLDDLFGSHVGSLTFHLTGNHMDILQFTSLAGQTPVNGANVINGGADGGPAPYWQLFLDATWTRDAWTVDYNVQWGDPLLNTSRQTIETQPNNLPGNLIHTPALDVHSVQVRYSIEDGYQLYAGISNLFYQKPSANDQFNGYPDSTGRFFYVGVQIDMDPFH